MKDQTETPATPGKAARRRSPGGIAAVASADLEAELANLRLLIRRQDEVVERLRSERAETGTGGAAIKEPAPTAKRARRSSRRGLLTQLAAGAAGVAAAAVYGSTKARTANAEFFGTNAGASTAQWGIYAYPNGVTQFPGAPYPVAGVYGQLDDNAPRPTAGAGVVGISKTGLGVLGQSSSGYGVYGTSPSGPGTYGVSTSSYGVQGYSASNYGVLGSSGASHGVGGLSSNSSFAGVYGESFNSGGNGVWGYNASGGTGVLGTGTSGPGVRGNSTGAPGVLGTSVNQPGVDGISTNSLGIRGTSTNFVGIVGISTNNHGLYGSTHGPSAYGIVAENLGGGPGLLVTGNAQIYGSLQVFGAPKNAIIKMHDGSFASVYCQESPEPYFEDFGKAQLVGGVASVGLEREFATLVGGGEYLVFLTPEGDTRGLFVSRKGPGGFDVREVQGGTANVPFTYRIVTKRKDIEGRRFARVSTDAADKVAGVRAVLASMPSAGTPPLPTTPPPGAPAPTPTPTQGFTVGPGLTVQQPGATPSSP